MKRDSLIGGRWRIGEKETKAGGREDAPERESSGLGEKRGSDTMCKEQVV